MSDILKTQRIVSLREEITLAFNCTLWWTSQTTVELGMSQWVCRHDRVTIGWGTKYMYNQILGKYMLTI